MSKKLALAICDFLTASIKNGTIKADDAEGIEVAIQCIGEAFGVDPTNEEQTRELSIKPATLNSIFDVYLKTQSKMGEKPVEEDAKAKAEELKSAGNKKMTEKKYDEAIDLYTKAIALDGKNAVFYANRQNNEHEKAVDDAKKALEVDPKYSKAYSRMGHAYFCLGKYSEAVDAYEKGLELDPDNATMKQSLATARTKAETIQRSASDATSTRSDPSAAGGGARGAAPDFASMLGNPNFMSMAQNMMQNPAIASMLNNPAIAQMAQNLMSDPQALQGLMNNPDLSRMAQNFMGGNQPNPNL